MFNVLFITADQWRADCLSAMAHPCLRTPNLDSLAAGGVLFRRHYSQASPCGPGRASLYTGLYLHNHRSVVNGTPLDARHTNVALEARKAGYDPVLFGHTDVSADPRRHHPDDPALRTYEGVLPGMTPVVPMSEDLWAWVADLRVLGYEIPPGPLEVFRPQDNYPGAETRGVTYAPARYKAEHSSAAFLTREAIKYLSVRGHEPWFLHLSFFAPHPPFVVPEPYHELYDPEAVPFPIRADSPEQEGTQHPWLADFLYHQRGTGFTVGKTAADNLALSPRDLRQIRATYFAMITEVDDQIGRLIEHLKSTDAYERTLIVFTSDHGEQLGDHWLFAKYGYFDKSFHIPLIVRDPRSQADPGRGRLVDLFTENVDVMPTILEFLGCEVPVQCDGESLLSFTTGETPEHWRRDVHWEFDFRDAAAERGGPVLGLAPDQCAINVIRDERYKYVHFAALPPVFFDLQEDPDEFRNLAGDPAYQGLVLDYAQKLLSWRMTHDERVLANNRLTPDGVIEHKGRRR